ncbi:hypothetical protein HNR42_002692 [Deinobacterium chartae]|uniref:OmpR/PhoB-type domain-containing protein n=1 Tax=Deinobacterium chartae TaxID=521158 RepID=A0A841I2M3_9DEIO|nr:GAF domain-containing protein [Deinobacterium chartae]MBB6099254.1 hypothetical protein [Deinobacterium chartae]
MNERLLIERQRTERVWKRFVTEPQSPGGSPPDLTSSWARSRLTVPLEARSAPISDPERAEYAWRSSPVAQAMRHVVTDLRDVALEGGMVVAFCDPSGQLLWTLSGRRMRRRAEALNFVPGGHWDEPSVGTNALDLALRTRRPSRVFAAEHYVPAVHDWVCYAAPVRDPRSGALLGVLDFSTTWDRATPLGLASVQHFAALLEQNLPLIRSASLVLRTCGTPGAQLSGREIHLTPRQLELLTVLALHPQGLTLSELHARLYGDRDVSPGTLKAEISALRARLGGCIAARPYRLEVPISLDLLEIEALLKAGEIRAALALCLADPFPHTASPCLEEWRDYLIGALVAAIVRLNDPETLCQAAARFPDEPEVIAAACAALAAGDPRRALFAARLEALLSA